jgi:hypothetical protein
MSSPVNIPLQKLEVLQALERALQNNFIDNLRNRHPNVQLDSKLRGYVGELAFSKWMAQHGIHFESSNQLDKTSGMDIDFQFRGKEKLLQLELKTSLIPDADETLAEVMRKRDIKLIQRENQSIEDLKGDIHVQFFFKQLRIRKDEWLKKQTIDLKASPESIYQKLAAFRYETDTYFLRWIDKESLIKQINQKPAHTRKWKYGHRAFWCCNLLKEAKEPMDLVQYLKEKQV